MRCYRQVMTLVVATVAALVLASVGAAGPGPQWPRPQQHVAPTPKVPALALVVKTAAMLPGADYPWVQPLFIGAYPKLPADIRVQWTQPPATIPISA